MEKQTRVTKITKQIKESQTEIQNTKITFVLLSIEKRERAELNLYRLLL